MPDEISGTPATSDVASTQGAAVAPAPSANPSGAPATPATTDPSSSTTTAKVQGIDEVRKWGEGYKKQYTDAEPLIKLITDDFGGVDNARLAHQIFSQVAGADFSPDALVETISKIAPNRASAIKAHYAAQAAEQARQTAISELFGRELSASELKSVQQFLTQGALPQTEDIPEDWKFDAEGNPLPEARVEQLRSQHRAWLQTQKQLESIQNREQEREQREQAARIEAAVDKYTNSRLEVINKAAERLGLNSTPEDAPEVASRKDMLQQILLGTSMFIFTQDEACSALYNQALKHLNTPGEEFLARNLEPRIEAKLTEKVNAVADIISALNESKAATANAQIKSATDTRPEITNGSGAPNNGQPANNFIRRADPFSREDMQKQLEQLLIGSGKAHLLQEG